MPLSQFTVFLIDDDESVRRSLGRVLSSAGVQWQSFASADAFLEAAPQTARGCVVADITMPGTSGLELLRLLQNTGSPPPVILITAHDTNEIRLAAREAGAAAFFRKPVDSQALLDAIAWAAGGPAVRQA
jgi:FixJ family two-component response regulator